MAAYPTAPTVDPLRFASEGILAPAGLDVGRVEQALGAGAWLAVDAADLYFQLSREESWALEDGIVKEGSAASSRASACGRMAGEKTGFAYSDEIMLPALEEAARAARAIARQGGAGRVQAWRPAAGHRLYLPIDPLGALSDEESRLAGARRSRDAPHRSARDAGHGERHGGARARAGGHAATACSRPTCGRWCASM